MLLLFRFKIKLYVLFLLLWTFFFFNVVKEDVVLHGH